MEADASSGTVPHLPQPSPPEDAGGGIFESAQASTSEAASTDAAVPGIYNDVTSTAQPGEASAPAVVQASAEAVAEADAQAGAEVQAEAGAEAEAVVEAEAAVAAAEVSAADTAEEAAPAPSHDVAAWELADDADQVVVSSSSSSSAVPAAANSDAAPAPAPDAEAADASDATVAAAVDVTAATGVAAVDATTATASAVADATADAADGAATAVAPLIEAHETPAPAAATASAAEQALTLEKAASAGTAAAAAVAPIGSSGKTKMARWRGKKEVVVGRQAVRRPRVGGQWDSDGGSGSWDVTQPQPVVQSNSKGKATMQFTNRFNVGEKLGEGGYGFVQTCSDTTGMLGEGPLAVKTISKEALYADCQRLEDLEARRLALAREVEVMDRVRGHEHVVQVKKVYNNSERLRVVMEMCEAGNLLEHLAARIELIRQERGSFGSSASSGFFGSSGGGGGGFSGFVAAAGFGSGSAGGGGVGGSGGGKGGGRGGRSGRGAWAGGLPENEAAALFKQLVEGVAFCHRRRVLHRDIKLENALLAVPTGRQTGGLEEELRLAAADMANGGGDGGNGANGVGPRDEELPISPPQQQQEHQHQHQQQQHHHHHFNLFSILPQGARSPAPRSPAPKSPMPKSPAIGNKSPRLDSLGSPLPPAVPKSPVHRANNGRAQQQATPEWSPIHPKHAVMIPPSSSESAVSSAAAVAAAVSAGSSAVSLGLVVKLADFGFALVLKEGQMTSGVCGTPGYMAPELVAEEQYSFPADIWSLGVVLHGLLFGELPNYQELTDVITEGVPRPAARKWKTVSEPARELHQAMLQLDPSKRPTAAEILKHWWFEQAEAALAAAEVAHAAGLTTDSETGIGSKSVRGRSGRAVSGRSKSSKTMEFLGLKGGGGREGARGGRSPGGKDDRSSDSPPPSPRVLVFRLKLGPKNLALRFKYGFIPTSASSKKQLVQVSEEEGEPEDVGRGVFTQ